MYIPALAYWDDYTHNPTDPDTRGYSLIYVNVILLFFALLTFSLRIYTRAYISRSLGWDDLAMTIGVLFTVGLSLDVILANVEFYWGRHIYDVPLTYEAISSIMKTQMAGKVLFSAATFFTRVALLLFYYRLVVDTGLKWFKRVIYASLLFDVATFIAFVVLSVFPCTPIQGYWTPGLGICLDEGKTTLANGVVNTVADLLTTSLPIPMIWGLRMPIGQKIGVMILLGLGFIVTIAGVVRTYYIWYSLFDSMDTTWYAYPLWIAAAVEVQLAVITACIPPIRPLISMKFPSLSNGFARFTEKFNRQQSFIYSPEKPAKRKDLFSSPTSQASKFNRDPQNHTPPMEKPRSPWRILTRQSVEVRRDTLPRDIEKQIDWKKPSWQEIEQGDFADESDSLDYPTTNSSEKSPRQRLRPRTISSNRSGSLFGRRLLSKWFTNESNSINSSENRSGNVSPSRMIISNPLRRPDPVRNASEQRIYEYEASKSQTRMAYPPQDHPSLAWPLSSSRPTTAPARSKQQSNPSRTSPVVQRVVITKNPFVHVDKSRLVARDERRARDSRATSISDHW